MSCVNHHQQMPPCHACPLSYMPPTTHTPLPCMHPPKHTPLPCMPSAATHAPCHALPLPCMPPVTYAPPAMHPPAPHHKYPLLRMPTCHPRPVPNSPPPRGQTVLCKNISFLQPLFRTVIIETHSYGIAGNSFRDVCGFVKVSCYLTSVSNDTTVPAVHSSFSHQTADEGPIDSFAHIFHFLNSIYNFCNEKNIQ